MRVRFRDDTGMVTAETAMVMPVFALLALMLGWATVAGIWQLRIEDAARTLTRAATMHVANTQLQDALSDIARDAQFSLDYPDEHHVKIVVTRRLVGPGVLPDIDMRATAVGRLENQE